MKDIFEGGRSDQIFITIMTVFVMSNIAKVSRIKWCINFENILIRTGDI